MGCFLHYAFSSKKKNLRSRRGRSDGPRPCADPGGHSPAYSDSGAFPQLEALLDIFNHTQSTFGDVAACERIAREAVLDAHAEGIRVLELQYAPSFASIGHGYAFEDVLSAVQGGVLEGQRQLGGADKIGVGAMGPKEMQKTTDFFLARQDAFCGFDMAPRRTCCSTKNASAT
jgi:adenosine deaminase